MQIVPEDVRKIAKLASLHLSDGEITDTAEDLNQIASLLRQLQSYSIDEALEPLEQPFPLDANQEGRPDQGREGISVEEAQKVAPQTLDNLYLVPKVID